MFAAVGFSESLPELTRHCLGSLARRGQNLLTSHRSCLTVQYSTPSELLQNVAQNPNAHKRCRLQASKNHWNTTYRFAPLTPSLPQRGPRRPRPARGSRYLSEFPSYFPDNFTTGTGSSASQWSRERMHFQRKASGGISGFAAPKLFHSPELRSEPEKRWSRPSIGLSPPAPNPLGEETETKIIRTKWRADSTLTPFQRISPPPPPPCRLLFLVLHRDTESPHLLLVALATVFDRPLARQSGLPEIISRLRR